ncbi:MAG: hypothetical protein NVS2B16_18800 [Chloroflexota bacterium]
MYCASHLQQSSFGMDLYRIRVAMKGTPTGVFKAAVPDIQEELEQREHLGHPRVAWDADREQIVIEVDDQLEAASHEAARVSLNDDLSDTVAACIADWDEWSFHILNVSHSTSPGATAHM